MGSGWICGIEKIIDIYAYADQLEQVVAFSEGLQQRIHHATETTYSRSAALSIS
jgi:hypothetical protein